MTHEHDDGTSEPPPVFRDKRRVDPDTGELRQPQETAAAGPAGWHAPDADAGASSPGGDPVAAGEAGAAPDGDVPAEGGEADGTSETERALAERTADLQRLQAEYVNYRRRVERDRESIREGAVATTLESLLPVLDDIGRARDAGELEGGFKAVAESLERVVSGLGLAPFGEAGDAFDPHRHEALMHAYSDDVDGPTCQTILQVGYVYQDKVVRAARVAVVEPEAPTEPAAGPAAGRETGPDGTAGSESADEV